MSQCPSACQCPSAGQCPSVSQCLPVGRYPPRTSQATQGGDDDAGTFTHPVRVRTELGFDPQLVRFERVAGAAQGPASDRVEQVVLHVLGELAGDVRASFRPLFHPPAAVGERRLEDGHAASVGVSGPAEIMQEQCSRRHQRVVRRHGRGPGTLGFMERSLLEVIVLGPADAVAAEQGGADRLEVVSRIEVDGLAPEPRTVAAIRQRTSLPLRVMLRLSEGFLASAAELDRLCGLAAEYAEIGADGFVFGFLTPDAEVDAEATRLLADHLAGRPWTFHRAIDHALDAGLAWRSVRELPGLDAVLSGGAALGARHGLDELVRRARADPGVASLLMAGGGLVAEHVPWLAQAGVRSFHVGTAARPDGSWKAYVDPGYVRAWRTLVDEEVTRAVDLAR